jgi:general secretion pathway protein D
VKGRWMPKIVLGLALAPALGRAQGPPQPTTPATTAGATAVTTSTTSTTLAGAPPPATEEEGERPLGEEEAMVLNFERADIRDVIHSLATALGLSYTIDPRIEGQITLRTTGKIPREDLFPLLNQILRNNGIAAVKVGDLYQFLPVGEAKTRAIIPRSAASRQRVRETDSFVIEIVPVKHVSPDEMANILQPFVTPGGDVLSYPRANLLVVTDLESNVERLRDLVATFDTDVFRNLRTRVYKVKEGDPEQLADEILGLLAPYGVAPTQDVDTGVYIVPLSRLNSIVVIAFDPSVFEEVERWLKFLDIPPEESYGRQTFVYNVENAKAVDLAAVLNELFGEGGPGGGGIGGRAPGAAPAGVGLFGAGGVSGRGGAGGGAGGRLGGRGGGGLGGGGGGVGGVGGIGQQAGAIGQQVPGGGIGGAGGTGARLGGGRAGGVAAGGAPGAPGAPGQPGAGARGISLGGRAGAGGGAPGQPQGPPPIFRQEVRIVADEVTNSLVILATRRDYQLIFDVIRRIDVVPRQVLLEVTIIEVTLTKDLQYGIAYAISSDQDLARSLPQGSQTSDIFASGAQRGSKALTGLFPQTPRIPGAGFLVLTNKDNFNVFLSALENRTNVKMLSAPHVIAADNREAHILVGDSIPILTSTATSTGITGTTGATINAVQYRDTGTILTILPQVNSKGLVNMQIRQEVSAVGQASFGSTNSPSFTTREAETTAVVNDGETVIIGGIIGDQISHQRSGLPYLMDIPVLGRAFRTETDNAQRTELIILISPYVIRDREEARVVTDEFQSRLEGLKRLGQTIRARHERFIERKQNRHATPPASEAPVVVPRSDPVPHEAAP